MLADAVGVYPNEPWPVQSECTPPGGNLPNVLDFARNESWQRVAATGDAARDFVVAPSTLGAAQRRPRRAARRGIGVVISELAGAGPRGPQDEFVELLNDGERRRSTSAAGRCGAAPPRGGCAPTRARSSCRTASSSRPGERFVVGGSDFTGRGGCAVRRGTDDGLADVEFGVAAAHRRRTSSSTGSPSRRTATAPARTRARSCPRCSTRSPPSRGSAPPRRRGRRLRMADRPPHSGSRQRRPRHRRVPPGVRLPGRPRRRDQRARDRPGDRRDAGRQRPAQLDRTRQLRHRARRARRLDRPPLPGRRHPRPRAAVHDPARHGARARRRLPGRPVGHAGGGAAPTRRYDVALNFLGTGVWVADAAGRRVDSVGVYAANEMDVDNVTASPCTKGVALTTYQPDRLLAETFQRSRFTGVDADDFVTAPATPGSLDTRRAGSSRPPG